MKVAVIGNGNWGTTVAKLVAENIVTQKGFDQEVIIWTYEETFEGSKISDDINIRHINPKYLPGVKLPHNIVSRVAFEFEDIDVLLFCLPHQFIGKLKEILLKKGVIAVNLCKGLIDEGDDLVTPSEYIARLLGIPCSCLMGANIASEVAAGVLSDCTLGYASESHKVAIEKVFEGPYFKTEAVPYTRSLEICGAIKNVISFAMGIADGQQYGKNTQAILFRRGLLEISSLCEIMESHLDVYSSACIGDLVVSCTCGRNYKSGVEIGKSSKSFDEYEKSLNGQKLQGRGTALVVTNWLTRKGFTSKEFPIIFTVNSIYSGRVDPGKLLEVLRETFKSR